jgi:uncharacterized protein with PQ loop repeat
MNPFVEAIGMLGGGLGFLISIPQLVRVVKHKSQVGVSLGTWLFIMMSTVGWTVYGWRVFSFSQIVTNTVAMVMAITLSYVLMRERFSFWMRVLILAAIAVPTALVVGFASEWMMDAWLYISLWSRVPQTLESYRSWRQARSTMVSLSSYWLSFFSSIAWVVYGLLTDRLVVVWFSAVVIVLSVLVVVFELLAQRAVSRRGLRTPSE